MQKNLIKFLILLTLFFIGSCKNIDQRATTKILFPIYISKDVEIKNENYGITVPVIDRYIEIDSTLSLESKLRIIMDTLSINYFNGLELEIKNIDSTVIGKICKINLKESSNFNGPGSLKPYESWYDFFQGSTGGMFTTIVLKESLLQRAYKGEWIDAIVFYYQDEKLDYMDHIDLSGIIKRYE